MAVTALTGGGAVSVRTESTAAGGGSGWLAGWLDVSGSVMTVPALSLKRNWAAASRYWMHGCSGVWRPLYLPGKIVPP